MNTSAKKSHYALQALMESEQLVRNFYSDTANIAKIDSAVAILATALKAKNKILSCGNGGSMSDAMHFAEELTGRYKKDRRPLPAMAISDPAHMSCVANDFGYDQIFGRTVEAFGRPGDVLLAISTSGKSPNIIEACKRAKAAGMKIIALSGKEGLPLKDLADVAFVIPSHMCERIQEMHIKLIHIFIEGVEREIFPELWS